MDRSKHFSGFAPNFGFGMGIIDTGSAYRDWNRQSAPERQAPSKTLSEIKSKEALAEERRDEEL
ncbi:MAG: hypothetical protein LJE89_12755 [Deltaproteobacteria bacterium]|nr:hypothetical protein [Deltaproteobacteria bacterium]